jgi:hypothetical protein
MLTRLSCMREGAGREGEQKQSFLVCFCFLREWKQKSMFDGAGFQICHPKVAQRRCTASQGSSAATSCP